MRRRGLGAAALLTTCAAAALASAGPAHASGAGRPSLQVTPTTAAPGSAITVTSNWMCPVTPDTVVKVRVTAGATHLLGYGVKLSDYQWRATVTLPAAAPAGRYAVTAQCRNPGAPAAHYARAELTVRAAPATTPPPTTSPAPAPARCQGASCEALAATGESTAELLLTALLLLAGGTLLWWLGISAPERRARC